MKKYAIFAFLILSFLTSEAQTTLQGNKVQMDIQTYRKFRKNIILCDSSSMVKQQIIESKDSIIILLEKKNKHLETIVSNKDTTIINVRNQNQLLNNKLESESKKSKIHGKILFFCVGALFAIILN